MRTERAFTLVETIWAAVILGLVMSLIIGVVVSANRMFHQVSLRAGLQSDALRVIGALTRDAALSDFWRCQLEGRITEDSSHRDGLALVALTDWESAARFDPATSLPVWDSYAVYYATMETPARLVRQVIQPMAGGVLSSYLALASNMSEVPEQNDFVDQTTVLCNSVDGFEVTRMLENGSLQVLLRLKKAGDRRANSQEIVVEFLETTTTVRLKNTWPKI